MSDHYFELRLDGRQPARYRTLQGAMTDAGSRQGADGGIWTVATAGAEPIATIRYTNQGTEVA